MEMNSNQVAKSDVCSQVTSGSMNGKSRNPIEALNTDRRDSFRINTHPPLSIIIDTSTPLGEIENTIGQVSSIGKDGVSFLCKEEFKKNKRLAFSINLNNRDIIEGLGQVIWSQKIVNLQMYLVGCNFIEIRNSYYIALKKFIQEQTLGEPQKTRPQRRLKERRKVVINVNQERRKQFKRRIYDKVSTDTRRTTINPKDVANRMKKRVVITGVGVVASNGIGKNAFLDAIINGRSGIRHLTRFDTSQLPSKIAGEIDDEEVKRIVNPKNRDHVDRCTKLGIYAALLAVEDAKIKLSRIEQRGTSVFIGTAIGGIGFAEQEHEAFLQGGYDKINPFFQTAVYPSSCANYISIILGIRGHVETINAACASGLSSIGRAYKYIQDGYGPTSLAGGTEAPLTAFIFSSFCKLNQLTRANSNPTTAYKPFAKDRDGFVLSEGSAILVLEELEHALDRNAHIYAEVVGFGGTCDAFHITAPSPNANERTRAMQIALNDAHISPDEIEYINAHGSGTRLNDLCETKAIKDVFGEHSEKLLISATKSMTGHSLGASGAIEMAACALMVDQGFLHPTINLSFTDPDCNLNFIPNKTLPKRARVIMKNSFGYGGINNSCILKGFTR